MAVCPFAKWMPLPENTSAPLLEDARVAILHSAAVPVRSLYNAFNRAGNNLESHFFVKKDGGIEQYMDTSRRADANYKANRFAVSIETEDNGNPNKDPWTDQQLASILRLLKWLSDVHPIPLHRCTAWNGHGVGFHTMWGSPSNWTPVAKSCPGLVRIGQFEAIIVPALAVLDNPLDSIENTPSGFVRVVVNGYVDSLEAPNGGVWHLQVDGGVFACDDMAGGPTAPFYGSVPAVGGLPEGVHVKRLLPFQGGYKILVQHPGGGLSYYHFPAR